MKNREQTTRKGWDRLIEQAQTELAAESMERDQLRINRDALRRRVKKRRKAERFLEREAG